MEFVQSGPGDEPVIVEGYFAAAPGLVFKAWTDPEIVVKWFGQAPNSLHSATIDLRPGGKWQFLITSDGTKSAGFEGRYLDIRADEKLVFSWSHVITHADGEREATPFSRVEVDFTARGKGTYVRLVHSAVRREEARCGIGSGWEAAFGHILAMFDEG